MLAIEAWRDTICWQKKKNWALLKRAVAALSRTLGTVVTPLDFMIRTSCMRPGEGERDGLRPGEGERDGAVNSRGSGPSESFPSRKSGRVK